MNFPRHFKQQVDFHWDRDVECGNALCNTSGEGFWMFLFIHICFTSNWRPTHSLCPLQGLDQRNLVDVPPASAVCVFTLLRSSWQCPSDLKDLLLRSSKPGSNPCVAFGCHLASHQSDVPAPPGPPYPHNDRHAAVKEAPGDGAAAAAARGPGRASRQHMESPQKRAAWWLAPELPGPSFRRQLGLWHGPESSWWIHSGAEHWAKASPSLQLWGVTDEREENAVREHKGTRYFSKSAQISFAPLHSEGWRISSKN